LSSKKRVGQYKRERGENNKVTRELKKGGGEKEALFAQLKKGG